MVTPPLAMMALTSAKSRLINDGRVIVLLDDTFIVDFQPYLDLFPLIFLLF